MTKTRLDLRLVEQGLAPTREKAQALIMAGRVRVDGRPVAKAGQAVAAAAAVEVLSGPEHVGRGAFKLEGALDHFGLDPAGRIAVDVGASTGGFTEVLLARGARRVYAVDVGRGQLHEKLRADPRVVVIERLNARELSPAHVPEPCRLATLDVSFISAATLLPPLRTVLAAEADVLVLVKPQFEVGREHVGRGGLVKEPALHRQAVAVVATAAQQAGYAVVDGCPSALEGSEGNREFFLRLRATGPGLDAPAVLALAARMVAR